MTFDIRSFWSSLKINCFSYKAASLGAVSNIAYSKCGPYMQTFQGCCIGVQVSRVHGGNRIIRPDLENPFQG